jgi:hypothetical protein
MKKTTLIFLSAILLTGTFVACKKGDNDPFLSLRSRKDRLSGLWTVKEETVNEVITIPGSTTTNNIVYDGEMAISSSVTVASGVSTTTIDTSKYSVSLEIKKTGNYEKKIVNANLLDIELYSGTWMFLGKSKIDKLKKKEAILITTSKAVISDGTVSNSYVYADLNGKTIVIDQLKNKEMITIVVEDQANETGLSSSTKTTKTTYTQK